VWLYESLAMYGTTYSLTSQMEENYALFEEIVGKIWKKAKDNDRE